ncbi:MAG: B-box zinc finger protein [Thermomicrobiales bacterium]
MSDFPVNIATTGPAMCAEHPDVETRLRCSRCGKPICPRCAVRTPVGMRCPDCAGTRAASKAAPQVVLTAAGAGLLVSVLTGIGWGLSPAWGFYWALILGFGSVEAMARFLRGRTGPDLQAIAIAIVVVGMVVSRVVVAQRLGVDLGTLNDFRPAVQRALYLRPIPDLLFCVLPIVIAFIRFR